MNENIALVLHHCLQLPSHLLNQHHQDTAQLHSLQVMFRVPTLLLPQNSRIFQGLNTRRDQSRAGAVRSGSSIWEKNSRTFKGFPGGQENCNMTFSFTGQFSVIIN